MSLRPCAYDINHIYELPTKNIIESDLRSCEATTTNPEAPDFFSGLSLQLICYYWREFFVPVHYQGGCSKHSCFTISPCEPV